MDGLGRCSSRRGAESQRQGDETDAANDDFVHQFCARQHVCELDTFLATSFTSDDLNCFH